MKPPPRPGRPQAESLSFSSHSHSLFKRVDAHAYVDVVRVATYIPKPPSWLEFMVHASMRFKRGFLPEKAAVAIVSSMYTSLGIMVYSIV